MCKETKKQKIGKKWTVIGSIGGFVLGVFATQILTSFFSPFVESIKDVTNDMLCPNKMWCPSYQTFNATASVQCQDGDVGLLVSRALGDGDLRSPQTTAEELAGKAYVCAELSWKEKRPIDHLKMLAARFEGCFAYQPYVAPEEGTGKIQPKFSVHLGTEQACLARVDKPGGKWKAVKDDQLGRVFCFPSSEPDQYIPSSINGLRTCTIGELTAIKIPQHVRDELAGLSLQKQPSP